MYYMIIHLLREERITEVLMALTEIDASSTQIVQCQSASKLLAFDVPIFAGFREMFGRDSERTQIICTVIQNREDVDDFFDMLKIANIDFTEDHIGEVFLLKLEEAFLVEEE